MVALLRVDHEQLQAARQVVGRRGVQIGAAAGRVLADEDGVGQQLIFFPVGGCAVNVTLALNAPWSKP